MTMFDFVLQEQQAQSELTAKATDFKCIYNCPCLCCRQGCCVVSSCCSCTNFSLICGTYSSSNNIANNRISSRSFHQATARRKVRICFRVGVIMVLGIIITIARRWLVALFTLLTSCITLTKRGATRSLTKTALGPADNSMSTSSCNTNSSNGDSKLKEQHGHWHVSYDITNDQQLKTNNLCKMFCNNRKRQRRRRRRRRRRRHRHKICSRQLQSGNSNNKQQQYHNSVFQLSPSFTCQSLQAWQHNTHAMKFRENNSLTDIRVSTLNTIVSSWPSSTFNTMRHFSKAKRNRTNLVWLLIGIFWLEAKLINCNAIASSGGYMSNFIAQKGCTLCQIEEGTYYSDKNTLHTDYNINNNNRNSNNNNHNRNSNNNNNPKYRNNNNNYILKKSNHIGNNNVLSDRVRLESIKRQILSKLGLTHKPNVSHPLPKQFVWETIYRADGGQVLTNDVFESGLGASGAIIGSHRKRAQPTENEIRDQFQASNMATKDADKKRSEHQNIPYIGSASTRSNKTQNRTVDRIRHHWRSVKYGMNKNQSVTWQTAEDVKSKIKQRSDRGRPQETSPSRLTNIWETKTKSNAYSKSTYLIDINRSSDSDSTKNDISEGVDHNEHLYFNDYSVQIQGKDPIRKPASNNARIGKEHNRKPNTLRMQYQDQDSVGFDREDFFGSTQEIITFAEEGTQYRQYRIVEFASQKTRAQNQKISIRSAEMHIRIERRYNEWNVKRESTYIDNSLKSKRKSHVNMLPSQRIKIWVFRMSEGINITDKAVDQAFLFRASFEVDTEHLGWQKFDLTETIREWYSGPSNENLRLLIDCSGCGSQYSLQLFQLAEPNAYTKIKASSDQVNQVDPNRPFLVLHTESTRPRRVRRRAIDCGGAISGQCCKESFYVSFKALGWDDWIIAPRGYFANYCRGECTGSFRTPDTFQTFHAHFIEEYRKMGLLNGMRPCCAPIKFSSMSLIYYGDDGIIKRDLPKMVVDECGCP